MIRKLIWYKKNNHSALIALLCAGILFLCFFSYTDSTLIKKKSSTKFVIGVNTNVKAAPVLIAEKQGYFRKAGVTVSVVRERTATNLLKGLYCGAYDFVCIPSFLAAQAFIESKPIKILAVLNRNQSRYLVMNPDFAENPRDLIGKSIGLNQDNAAEHVLTRFLILNSVPRESITLEYYDDSALLDVFSTGHLAAILTWPPNLAAVREKMNGRILVSNAQMGEDVYWLLVTRSDIAKNETIEIESIFRALDNSYTLIFRNPKKAKKIISERLSVPLEGIEEEWRDFVFLLEMPQSLLLIMEQQCEWICQKDGRLFDSGRLFSIYDYHHLERVFPERVSMIR